MRLTLAVWKQHLKRMTKKNWHVQGKCSVIDTHVQKKLENLGIEVTDINDVVKDMKIVERRKEPEASDTVDLVEPLPVFNETHPLFKKIPCYIHRDNTVLLGGLDQAKVVAKAVQVSNGLPKIFEERIHHLNITDVHKLVQRSILASHVFDAQQEKLPRLHDPDRPAWNFPREYGITAERSIYLLCEKLVQLCNTWSHKQSSLFAINNGKCVVPVHKDGDLIQFELTLNMSLLSTVPHEKFSVLEEEKLVDEIILPDIYPVKSTVTFEKTHFYENKDIFPVSNVSKFCNLHTIIIHYNGNEIKNLYETPVQESQMLGRCLLYGFATSVAQARQIFKNIEEDLPFPVCVQCIQTDGRVFDFSIFQLNTLNVSGNEGVKNMFWMLPRMELFSLCGYQDGRPTLEGYNAEVFNTFMSFCTNH